ncbi:MAG TPA: monovalent cation/H+ antiporter complex subunit F [Chthoniobacteraceae bacterium]|nr:monovalent cation/H+ antiporter complex subunit F [Chthoniobacteraceae bacterium]
MSFYHLLAFPLLAAIGCGLWRALRGPTILDRMLGLDLIVVCSVGVALLLGLEWGTAVLVDWVLAITLLGFLSTVALTIYLMKSEDRQG